MTHLEASARTHIKMKMLFFVVWFYILSATASENCNYRKPIYNTFTPYRFVKPFFEHKRENQESFTSYQGKRCHVVNLYLFLRHGARSPLHFEIQNMTNLHFRLRNNHHVVHRNPFLRTWINPFPESLSYAQFKAGEKEQQVLAQRYGNMFKDLFNGNLNRIKYSITEANVTVQSYMAFYDSFRSLFRSNMPRPPAVIDNNKLLFYSLCNKLDRLDDIARYPYNSFYNGSEIGRVVDKVQIKLGTTDITRAEVLIMHRICAFEIMLFDRSDWCKFFEKSDILVIDYLIELLRYWKNGYGFPINWQSSCHFTSNLFQTFDYFIGHKSLQSRLNVADIHFSHGFALLPIYAAFDLFKDHQPLLASNYASNKNRLFQSRFIAPMSGNFAVGLYKCGDHYEDYVVKMFVNEESVVIPRCGSKVCPYYVFKSFYNSLTSDFCDFDRLCENRQK